VKLPAFISLGALIGVVFAGAFGTVLVSNLPIVLGIIARGSSFDVQALGWMASSALGGIAAGIAAASWYVVRTAARDALRRLALIQVVACMVMALGGSSLPVMALCLLAIGFGGGGLTSIAMAMMGRFDRPDRAIVWFLCGAVAIGALYAPLLTYVEKLAGIHGMWWLFGGSAVLVFVMTFVGNHQISTGSQEPRPQTLTVRALQDWNTSSMLVSSFCCGLGIMMPWAFAERMADANGLDPTFVSTALGAGLLVSLPTTAVYGLVAHRFPRSFALLFGVPLIAGSAAVFADSSNRVAYLIASGAFQFGWTISQVACVATLTRVDKSGRGIVLGYFVFKAAYSIAPVIAGALVTSSGYAIIAGASATLFLSAWVLAIISEHRARNMAA